MSTTSKNTSKNIEKNQKKSIIKNFKITKYKPFVDKTGLNNLSYVNLIFGNNGSGKTRLSKLFANITTREDENIKVKYYNTEDKNDIKILVFNADFVQKYFYYHSEKKELPAHESFSSKENNEILKELDKIELNYQKKALAIKNIIKNFSPTRGKNLIKIIEKIENFLNTKNTNLKQDIKRKIKNIFNGIILDIAKKDINNENIEKEIKSKICAPNNYEFLRQNKIFETKQETDLSLEELKKQFCEIEKEGIQSKKEGIQSKIGIIFDTELNIKLKNVKEWESFDKILKKNKSPESMKILQFWKKNKNYLNWLSTGFEFYKTTNIIEQDLCLFCQEKTFKKEKVFKLLSSESGRINFEELQNRLKKIQKNGDVRKKEENDFEKLKEEIQNWKFENWKTDLEDLTSLFDEYKNNCEIIWDYVEKIKNWQKAEQKDVIIKIKRIIKKFNDLSKKFQDQLLEIYKNKVSSLKEIADKILELKILKLMKPIEAFDKVNKAWKNCEIEIENYKKKKKEMRQDDEIIKKINKVLKIDCKFQFELKYEKNYNQEKYIYTATTNFGDKVKIYDLSEGEKTMLSFLYFLYGDCKNKIKKTGKEKFLIFVDDPTTSLTEENSSVLIMAMLKQIKNYYDCANVQYIITSHKFNFIYQFKKWANFKQIDSNALTSNKIHQIKEGKKVLSKFDKNNDKLFNFYQESWKNYEKIKNSYQNSKEVSDILELPNIMRKIIDTFIEFWGNSSRFDDFLDTKLTENKFVEDYRRMYRLINEYSHISINRKCCGTIKKEIEDSYSLFEKFFESNAMNHFIHMTKPDKTINDKTKQKNT